MTIKGLGMISLSMIAAFLASRGLTNGQDQLFERSKDLPEIMYLIDRAYVDQVDVGTLMPGAFQHALEEVDPNAAYLAPGEQVGDVAGTAWQRTGLALAKIDGLGFVLSVAEGSPAAKAGIQSGSWLRRINGLPTRTLGLPQMQRLLAETTDELKLAVTGPDGDTPTLVASTGAEDLSNDELSLKPEVFKPIGLVYKVFDDGIHLLRLPQFHRGWVRDLKKALNTAAGAEAKVVLDLRGNALGDDQDFLDLAQLFLPEGTLAYLVQAKKPPEPVVNAKAGKYRPSQFFILQDHGTSRAAEAFAAVAKDLNAAVLVGVQGLGLPDHYQTLPLPGGGAVYMSTRLLKLKSDVTLTGKGMAPDLLVAPPKTGVLTQDLLLQEALVLIRGRKPEPAKP